MLDRLLALNHERYAEEVRQGLHEKKGKKQARRRGKRKKTASKKTSNDKQMTLF